MVRRRQRERSLFEMLLPDGHKLWPDWLRRIDTVLEDEAVIEVVAQALEVTGVNQTHEEITDVRPFGVFVEEGVLAMENRVLQPPFAQTVVERGRRVDGETGQRPPVRQW